MKHKLSIEIYKPGSENDVITRMVANYNDGGPKVTAEDIKGYLRVRMATYPSSSNYSWEIIGNHMRISEDGGKSCTLTLIWKEVYELAEVATSDDLKDINI